MEGIKSLANMACEVSKYEGLVAISVQGRSFCHKERPCVLLIRQRDTLRDGRSVPYVRVKDIRRLLNG